MHLLETANVWLPALGAQLRGLLADAGRLLEQRPLPEQVVCGALVLLFAARLSFSARTQRVQRVILLGSGPMAGKIAQALEAHPELHRVILGVVDEAPQAPALERYPYLGRPARLLEIVERCRPDLIVVAQSDRRGHLPMEPLLAARARGVVIEDGEETYECATGKVAIESLQAAHMLFGEGFRRSALQHGLQRALSLLFAALGLFVAAPLFAIIALAIKLDSPGPVLFRHRRIGLRGRPFELLKFRTMRPVERAVSEWAADNQERITRVGAVLRKLRLDELPQFINILRGDMNLVGPRPHPLSNHQLFDHCIPYYFLRCTVRPGLTGWAQVRYRYANSLAEETEKMRYDLYYIKHRSAWLDLLILPATLRAVLARKGAFEIDRTEPAVAVRRR